jgi:hypothetical protein
MTYDQETVFSDGMTLKNVQDAVAAAATTGMWHVAYELATRYSLQNVICMKCGILPSPHDHTYEMHGGHAIRKCLSCSRGNSRR